MEEGVYIIYAGTPHATFFPRRNQPWYTCCFASFRQEFDFSHPMWIRSVEFFHVDPDPHHRLGAKYTPHIHSSPHVQPLVAPLLHFLKRDKDNVVGVAVMDREGRIDYFL
jgi:hypothetical protein